MEVEEFRKKLFLEAFHVGLYDVSVQDVDLAPGAGFHGARKVLFYHAFLVRGGAAVGIDEFDTRVLPAEIAVYQDVCQFGGVLIVRTLRKTIQFLFGAEAGFGHSLAHLLAYEKAGRVLTAFGQCLLSLLDDVRVKPAAER